MNLNAGVSGRGVVSADIIIGRFVCPCHHREVGLVPVLRFEPLLQLNGLDEPREKLLEVDNVVTGPLFAPKESMQWLARLSTENQRTSGPILGQGHFKLKRGDHRLKKFFGINEGVLWARHQHKDVNLEEVGHLCHIQFAHHKRK